MPEVRTSVRRPRLLYLIVAAGVLLAFLLRGYHSASDRGSATPLPADSAVVRGSGDGSPTQAGDTAPARPAQGPSAPSNTDTAPGGPEADANAAALASVLARLRAEQDRAQTAQQEPDVLPEVPQAPAAAQPPAESKPPASQPVVWPYTTPAETRWDLRCAWDGCLLLIDLGAGQIANVQAAPQFGGLERDAMDERVDYVRGVIQQAYGAQAGVYRFTRDGRVFPIR